MAKERVQHHFASSLAVLILTLIMVVLLGYPFSLILQRADFSTAVPPGLIPTVLYSLRQAGWSLAVCLVLGVPLGSLYAAVWTRWLRGFSIASFSLPGLLVIGTISLALHRTAYRFGLPAVVIAHAFLNIPWIALATAEGIRTVPAAWIEASRTLGATRMRTFSRFELPWISRRIALASAQVFALCLMSFAIVMVLGGGPPVVTLETEIYASVRGAGLQLSHAAWFAIIQFGLAAIPLLCVAGLRRRQIVRDSLALRSRQISTPPSGLSLAVHAFALAWLLLPGVLFLFHSSVARLTDLLHKDEFQEALGVSLRIGFTTALMTVALGLGFAFGSRRSRFVRVLAALPIGFSPLMVALGFFLAYSSFMDPFEGSMTGMVLVQASLFLPFTLRFFLPLLDEEMSGARLAFRQTARTLGATPFGAWKKLEWPLWRAASLRLAALVFVWSFSELAAASFFSSERITPLGALLIRWMAQYRFEEVSAILFGIYVFSSIVLVAVGVSDE